MSDRIAVMNEGRILQLGTPDDVYERPRDRFVADFIGQMNFLEAEVAGPEGEFVFVDLQGAGHLRARRAEGQVAGGRVTLAVRPEKISLLSDLPDGAAAGWNRLTGRLADVVYAGTFTQYAIALPEGQTVVVHRQNWAAGDAEMLLGENVTVVFDPRSAVLLDG